MLTRFLVTALVLCNSFAAFAFGTEIAETKSGKSVILKEDGTWAYLGDGTKNGVKYGILGFVVIAGKKFSYLDIVSNGPALAKNFSREKIVAYGYCLGRTCTIGERGRVDFEIYRAEQFFGSQDTVVADRSLFIKAVYMQGYDLPDFKTEIQFYPLRRKLLLANDRRALLKVEGELISESGTGEPVILVTNVSIFRK